ncbi:hypothetical protein KAR91_21870 [Candidatus Pacearchaeota archaeon]|nr:hypothetical protein [Candidatus Pacearchaeota archaeon]
MASKNLEIGVTGLKRSGGRIYEEFLTQLKGTRAIKIYKEMSNNDPVIGAILFAVEMLIRNVEWRVEPNESDNDIAAQEAAEFVDNVMNDMAHTWADFIAEALSMLTFGYSIHEVVYKRREDGMIGWSKLPIRSQDSLWEWKFDDAGNVIAFVQQSPVDGSRRTIPAEKMLHFRTTTHKNNPEGKSALRNAYRPWFFKKRIEEIEGIGIERDLAGLPVAYVPPAIMAEDAGTEEKATLNAIRNLIINIRRDEQEGVVFPLSYDANGNKQYELTLLTTGGKRQFDTSQIVNRYDQRITMTVLADFILLGHEKVGSFALSSDKTSMFATAIGAWLKGLAAIVNNDAIPSLMTLNGIPRELQPKVVPGDLEKEDIEKFIEAVNKMVLSGVLIPTEGLETKVKEMLDIPAEEGLDENRFDVEPEEEDDLDMGNMGEEGDDLDD